MKTGALEEEIVELETSTENISQTTNKDTYFEIHCKTKLNELNKFLGKHT